MFKLKSDDLSGSPFSDPPLGDGDHKLLLCNKTMRHGCLNALQMLPNSISGGLEIVHPIFPWTRAALLPFETEPGTGRTGTTTRETPGSEEAQLRSTCQAGPRTERPSGHGAAAPLMASASQ